jgi:hypothetical protein
MLAVRTPAAAWKIPCPMSPDPLGHQCGTPSAPFPWRTQRPAADFPLLRLDGKQQNRILRRCSVCIMGVLSRRATTRRPRGHRVPSSIFCEGIGWHQIRTRSSRACLASGLKRHGATQTPPLWEDECIMSEETRSERHCESKFINHSSHPKIGSSKCSKDF